jgi:hypothetical protein
MIRTRLADQLSQPFEFVVRYLHIPLGKMGGDGLPQRAAEERIHHASHGRRPGFLHGHGRLVDVLPPLCVVLEVALVL